MVQVEEKRLAGLLREELNLKALKAGGVDNQECYDDSLYGDALEDNDMPKFNQIEDMSDKDIIKDYL